MAILAPSGGTANATYTPGAGWTSYDTGFVYSDATSIKNASATFGVILENSLSGGALTSKVNFIADQSGAPTFGPVFETAALTGFAAVLQPATDAFLIVIMTAGVDGTVLASGSISTYVTLVDGNPYQTLVEFDAGTNAIVFKLDGVTLASTTYTGGASGLHGGVQGYNNTNNKITQIEVTSGASFTLDTLSSPVVVGGTGYSGTTTGLGAVTSLTNATINSASAGSFSYSMNSFSNGVAYLPMGSQTFTAGDGTDTATKASTVQTMSGYTSVLLSTMNTGAWSLGKDPAFISGNTVHLPTAAGTLNNDGTLTDYVFGSYSGWMQDQSDNKMYSFTLTVTDSGLSTGSCMPSTAFFLLFNS
jgi:hypothetical protein